TFSAEHPTQLEVCTLSLMDAATVSSITSKAITGTIDNQVFGLVGSPRCFVADNGTSFQSVHFRGWAASWGIQ
ncbi:hypothetical protein Pmar_PMAR013029, partial [Perkinsus marinus ATCC 50983]